MCFAYLGGVPLKIPLPRGIWLRLGGTIRSLIARRLDLEPVLYFVLLCYSVVLRPTRELSTHMETKPLSTNGYKF